MTGKKTKTTTKPKREILRIRDLKLSTNPQSLLELLKRYDINPVDILIKMDEKRRVTAFITMHENSALLPLIDLLDRNINAWVVNEEEHGKLRWPRSTGWQAIGPMI